MEGQTMKELSGNATLVSAQREAKGLERISYFVLTVLGFSFWFFMVAPFASHRETYSWLAGALTEDLRYQLSFGLSSTYRPLSQVVTWSLFAVLDPRVFPTSTVRQALLQGLVYGMFLVAWWHIYSAAPQRRLFALISLVVGGTMFSGYVHLFHIYGMMYVPVILMMGSLLYAKASGAFPNVELLFALVAIVLAFWHPFATALFVGFYFGHYLETFWQRRKAQHILPMAVILIGMIAVAAVVFVFPRARTTLDSRLLGFLVSYQTNEINYVVSLVVLLLTEMVIWSTWRRPPVRTAVTLVVLVLGIVFVWNRLPVLFIWIGMAIIKLLRSRLWSLLFLMLTAALFPFGGALGTPIHALFAIIMAAYVTSLGWSQADEALSFMKPRHIAGVAFAAMAVALMVRVGVDVPIVTTLARPLLVERERTYQLEGILAWLHTSPYCGSKIAFAENAGNPIDSVESAITRRRRPPAGVEDVGFFWDTVLRCRASERGTQEVEIATVTFDGPPMAKSRPVFEISGRYAGDAVVWIGEQQNR